jgi:uncharacterized membrane protein YfcA
MSGDLTAGTHSAMVAATATMGSAGHAAQGHFDPNQAIPLAVTAVIGGLTGGSSAIKPKPDKLKQILAYPTVAEARFLIFNALVSE